MNLSVNLPVSFIKEGRAYIAYCPILDLSTSANTFEKAKERFTQIVEIFFEELVEMGTLNEVLTNFGWVRLDNKWVPPLSIGHGLQKVTIPIKA